jgi:hypothetical protein
MRPAKLGPADSDCEIGRRVKRNSPLKEKEVAKPKHNGPFDIGHDTRRFPWERPIEISNVMNASKKSRRKGRSRSKQPLSPLPDVAEEKRVSFTDSPIQPQPVEEPVQIVPLQPKQALQTEIEPEAIAPSDTVESTPDPQPEPISEPE